jgi:hypothetical protein
MRRLPIMLAAGAGAILATTGAPAAASSSQPYATGVLVTPAAPSTIAASGAFVENISEVGPSPSNCGFHLYRRSSPRQYGGVFKYLGFYTGTQTTGRAQVSVGYLQYQIRPTDCTGNTGSAVYSTVVVPTILDNPFSTVSGSATTVHSASYYGGSALQTTSNGADVRANFDTLYNIGIVVGTGPRGGIGTVYADGVQKGTINFYSATVGGMKVLFKVLGLNPFTTTQIDIVASAGAAGGHSMYLDALVGNLFPD